MNYRFTGDKDLIVECPICGHSVEVGIQDEAVCPECKFNISISESGDAEVLCGECQELSGSREDFLEVNMRKLVRCNVCGKEKEVVFLFMSRGCESCGIYDCRNCLNDYFCTQKCRKIAEFK